MQKIKLNGDHYTPQKCKEKLNSVLPAWERHIFHFLVDWFSPTHEISIQTSGSTDTPKLIQKKKSTLKNSALMTGEYFGFKPNQKALLCLPANFIAGKIMLVRAIVWELDLIYIEPKINMEIPKFDFFFSAMTPQQASANISQLNSIQNLIIGGAPISNNLENQLLQLKTNSFATYGMTETVSHIALRKIAEQKKHYQVFPNISITTDDRDCLVIEAPLLSNESLITNDLVQIISSTSFVWKGRIDNVINTGGIKVSSEEIENRISAHISKSYFIAGLPDEKWGEKIALFIEGAILNSEELLQSINQLLQKHEHVKEVHFVPDFKRTSNGKIQRKDTIQLI